MIADTLTLHTHATGRSLWYCTDDELTSVLECLQLQVAYIPQALF